MADDIPVRLSEERRPLSERMKDAEARIPGFLSKTKLIHMDLIDLSRKRSQLHREDVLLFFYKYNVWIGPSNDPGLLDWLREASLLPDKGFEILLERMLDKEEELFALFKSADESGNGQIDAEELRRLCFLCGEPFSLQEASAMMRIVDRDVSGTISYQEWFNAMGVYHNSLPGMRALSRNVKESARIFLKELQKKSRSRVVDNGFDNFHLEDLARSKTSSVPKSKFLLAAFGAALVTRTLTAPLDRLNCLLQVPVHARLALKSGGGAVPPSSEFRSARQTFRDVVQREGVAGLWRGNLINVLRVVPEIATRAYFFEAFKELEVWLDPSVETKSELPIEHRLFGALGATALAQVLFYPINVLRTQLQVVAPSRKLDKGSELWRILRHDMKTSGFLSLYRGLCPSMIRVGLDMTCFEMFKILHVNHIHPKFSPNETLPTISMLGLIGTLATTTASFVSYPLLLVRTRMQVSGMLSGNEAAASSLPGFKRLDAPGMLHMAERIVKEGGFRALYRGYAIHLAKTVPSTASSMACYELLKRNLGIKTVF